MITLHTHKYSAGGGFKRMAVFPRFRETQRWHYSNRYWIRAVGTWLRILVIFLTARWITDIFKQGEMIVSYSFANLEYWPINENIDFILIIPHWYLRPLMGALVTIPHHYLGFIYIGLFFIFIILAPWAYERNESNSWEELDSVNKEGWTTTRWDLTHFFVMVTFLFGAIFTTAIIPTGKYFIALGSMDGLIYTYWILLLYITALSQISIYSLKLNWYLINL